MQHVVTIGDIVKVGLGFGGIAVVFGTIVYFLSTIDFSH